MSIVQHRWTRWIVTVAVIAACGPGEETPLSPPTADPQLGLLARSSEWGDWSEPVWLGPEVNSERRDLNPELAPDGRSLYFTSDRDGAVDIYVSRRSAPGCAWGPPVKLGPPIDTDAAEFNPALSPDGRWLYFGRGDHSGQDIYVSYRRDRGDDFAWEEPVALGPEVNTPDNEHGPEFSRAGGGELYFNRGSPPGTDIWVVPMRRNGRIRGPSHEVTELNSPNPTTVNGAVTVSRDGRELIFWSGGAAGPRPGTVGLADLFVSTRRSPRHPWSEPVGLGTPLNHEGADLEATLSEDGRTLIFSTARPGGLGLPDLWMSERDRDERGSRWHRGTRDGCAQP